MNPETRHTLVEASRPVRWAAAAALAMLALFLLVKTFDAISLFGQGENPQVNTVTVTGEGKSSATPDIAKISFTVQQSAADVRSAQDAATKQANDAVAAMKGLGVADKDVTTSDYNVSPQYAEQNGSINFNKYLLPGAAPVVIANNTNKITGYQVSESVEVTVRDVSKAGDVVSKLGTLGVQNISGPNFTFDDDNGVMDDARANAIKNAHDKAIELAKELGVSLGEVVSYTDQNGGYPMPMYDRAVSSDSAGGAAMAPNLPVGQQEQSVIVQVTYRIK